MRRTLGFLLALIVLTPAPVPAAEERLVIYTAYEENELKDFWEQFKKDLPDLAAKASYIRASTGPVMARVEAEKANPQADVIWGVFNDYLTGAANKGLLDAYEAKESGGIVPTFRHPQNLWQGVTLLTVAFAVNQKKMQELKLTAPRSWEDLLDPRYKGHIVMSNPSEVGRRARTDGGGRRDADRHRARLRGRRGAQAGRAHRHHLPGRRRSLDLRGRRAGEGRQEPAERPTVPRLGDVALGHGRLREVAGQRDHAARRPGDGRQALRAEVDPARLRVGSRAEGPACQEVAGEILSLTSP